MARLVIKSFRNRDEGDKIYIPGSRRKGIYSGDREDELFEAGYLGPEVDENGNAIKAQFQPKTEAEDEELHENQVDEYSEEYLDEHFTVAQLSERLDVAEVEYPSKPVKKTLIELVIKHKA